jgi:enoyl-[acyl-carrier protein] reductase I
LSGLSSGVTGEIHHVDLGYNIVLTPHPSSLKEEASQSNPA